MQTLRESARGIARLIRGSPAMRRVKVLSKAAFSDKYLLVTNMSISVSLSASGDWLEQRYEVYSGQLSCWDSTRTAHMAFSGATVGFLCHHWYRILDHRIPGRAISTVVKKLLLDQLFFSPVVIALFFASVALFEEVTAEEFKEELRQKFWRLYAAEWVVWPPAQFINFYILPPRYRVLYDNTISLGYDIFTSRVKHAKVEDSVPHPPPAPSKVPETHSLPPTPSKVLEVETPKVVISAII